MNETCIKCPEYAHDTDIDVQTFCCMKGHWSYSESPDGKEGEFPEKPLCKATLNCKGNTYIVDRAFIDGLYQLQVLKTEGQKQARKMLDETSLGLNRLLDYAAEQMKGKGRDRHLPSELEKIASASPDIPQESAEWVKDTDFAHTIATLLALPPGISFQEKKILLSAIIMHDCAYPLVHSYDGFEKEECRIAHMQNAETAFNNFPEKTLWYNPEEADKICKIARQHDNPGIKKDFDYTGINPELLWHHREADRIWMLDPAGFALDLLREITEKNRYDPAARLAYVIKNHQKEPLTYKDTSKCIPYQGTKTIYHHAGSFDLFLRRIAETERTYIRGMR